MMIFMLLFGGNDIVAAFTIVKQRQRCGHDCLMRNNGGRSRRCNVAEGWYGYERNHSQLTLTSLSSDDVAENTIMNNDNTQKRDVLRKQTLDAALLAMHSISCQINENTANNIDNASSQLFNQR
jgi:hypothetical protein